MVAKGIKPILPLIVLFSYITQITNFYIQNSIKQLGSLLFLLFLSSVLIPFSSFAKQNNSFESPTNIYSIVQDEQDFIWLSGQNGLYRFDGSQLINFTNNNQTWPIPFNWINSISVNNEQLILATETQGLWLLDSNTAVTKPINIKSQSNTFYKAIYHNGSFYAVSMAPEHLYRYEVASGETTILRENVDNTILLSSNNRVYFNDKEKLYYIDSTNDEHKVNHIKSMNERIVDAASAGSTAIIASNTSLFKLSDTGTITKERILSPISTIAISNDNQYFFTVDFLGKIIKRDLETLQKHHNTFPAVAKSRYQALLHDSSGVLWLVSNSGVLQLIENTVKNHLALFDTKFSTLETEVYENQLYIGSFGKGVHTLSPYTKHQVNAVSNINKKLSNSALRIMDIMTIGDELFIATFDGLWRYNKKKQQTQKINLYFENKNISNLILLKLRHTKNSLYIAADGQGLIVYDLEQKKVIKHIDTTAGLSSGEVIDILPVDSGDIWLATASGIDIIRKNTNVVDTITSQTKAKFMSLLQADGKVFAATKGDGIQAYNLQGKLLTHFAKGKNFSYMTLINNNIFASAKPGLYKVNPKNYQFTMVSNTGNFSFTDNAISFNDSLYIANNLGILQLPQNIETPYHPKVFISKTTVSGKSYLLNKTINIDSGNDVITLDLASLDYRPGVAKKFSYTLNGNNWHQISDNQLTLTGLASGDYHVEIMATNSLGQWSDYKAYTEISVAFPWYWTPQIRLVYTVAILGTVCFIAWLLYLRSRSISHIHKILQSDINNYSKTTLQVKRNLTVTLALLTEGEVNKSKHLLQQCVDGLSDQQKMPEPNSLNGNSLTVAIPFLANYLQTKYQTKLFFQFDINEDELEYELRADLYKVVYEAITSAILKGSGRNFKVVIQKFKSKIWLNISDDSQSFINFNSKVNMDISMYYIRQIANKHKGSINTFNEHSNGSQLVLSLPIKRNN